MLISFEHTANTLVVITLCSDDTLFCAWGEGDGGEGVGMGVYPHVCVWACVCVCVCVHI